MSGIEILQIALDEGVKVLPINFWSFDVFLDFVIFCKDVNIGINVSGFKLCPLVTTAPRAVKAFA